MDAFVCIVDLYPFIDLVSKAKAATAKAKRTASQAIAKMKRGVHNTRKKKVVGRAKRKLVPRLKGHGAVRWMLD